MPWGAGVCVLASDIPENCEVVEGAGFTFIRGDVSDLARMLQLLISDKPVRDSAARLGQQRVRDRYLWPQLTADIERTYYDVLGYPQPAPVRKEPSPKPTIPEHVA